MCKLSKWSMVPLRCSFRHHSRPRHPTHHNTLVSLLLHLLQLLLILDHTLRLLLLSLQRCMLCLHLLHHHRILSSTNRSARAHLLLLLLLLLPPTLFVLIYHHLLYHLDGRVVDLRLQALDMLRSNPTLIPICLCH